MATRTFFISTIKLLGIAVCSAAYLNAVYFYLVAELNHKTALSFHCHGGYQICTFRIYLDDNIRGFDLKASGVGNIVYQKRSSFPCGSIIKLIKGFQLFFLYAALFKQGFDLLFIQGERLWDFLVFFYHLRQIFMNAFYNLIIGLFAQGLLDQRLKGFLLASGGKGKRAA